MSEFLDTHSSTVVAVSSTTEVLDKGRCDLDFEDGWLTIIPSGDLDADLAEDLRNHAISALDGACSQIKVDLKNVTGMHVQGFTVLFNFGRMLADTAVGKSLEIVNVSAELVSLFGAMKIDRFCTVTTTQGAQ